MLDGLSLFFLLLIAALALGLLLREGCFKKPWLAALCAVLVSLAVALRASVFDVETGDYTVFLSAWVSFYRENGGFLAFASNPPYCNYHVPYLYFLALFSYLPVKDLYLIKLLSVFFDVILAWVSMKLVSLVTKNTALRLGCFFAVLFWPTVFLNGALWGQCDSIYVALALLGLWLALKDRPILSMAMFAFSFGFKLQAIFVLPVIAVLWFYGKYNWKHLFVFPLAYLLLMLPAILMGRPPIYTIFYYFWTTESAGASLNYNSASVFAIFWDLPEEQQQSAATVGIVAAFLFLLNLLGISFVKRKELTDRSVICLALLMAIGIPFLLPHMHDRYFFPADLLSLVLAFSMWPFCLTAPLTAFASFLGYYAYLSFFLSIRGGHFLLPMKYGAYALIAALALTGLALAVSFRRKDRPSGGKHAKPKSAKT